MSVKMVKAGDIVAKKHFVTFFSPGTFVAESNTEEVESWDVAAAQKRAAEITQRHGAVPYGFRFHTMGRTADELGPKETARSPMYFLHVKIHTLEELEKRDDPKDRILISNMRANGHKRVVTTTKGWMWTQPLDDADVVLE